MSGSSGAVPQHAAQAPQAAAAGEDLVPPPPPPPPQPARPSSVTLVRAHRHAPPSPFASGAVDDGQVAAALQQGAAASTATAEGPASRPVERAAAGARPASAASARSLGTASSRPASAASQYPSAGRDGSGSAADAASLRSTASRARSMSLGASLLGARPPLDAGSCSSMTLECVISQVRASTCCCCWS